jgi:hypothetical protein
MKHETSCRRILLAGVGGCRVIYCSDCDVTEVELGAMSLRLKAEDLVELQAVLAQACRQLATLKVGECLENLNHRHVDLH